MHYEQYTGASKQSALVYGSVVETTGYTLQTPCVLCIEAYQATQYYTGQRMHLNAAPNWSSCPCLAPERDQMPLPRRPRLQGFRKDAFTRRAPTLLPWGQTPSI